MAPIHPTHVQPATVSSGDSALQCSECHTTLYTNVSRGLALFVVFAVAHQVAQSLFRRQASSHTLEPLTLSSVESAVAPVPDRFDYKQLVSQQRLLVQFSNTKFCPAVAKGRGMLAKPHHDPDSAEERSGLLASVSHKVLSQPTSAQLLPLPPPPPLTPPEMAKINMFGYRDYTQDHPNEEDPLLHHQNPMDYVTTPLPEPVLPTSPSIPRHRSYSRTLLLNRNILPISSYASDVSDPSSSAVYSGSVPAIAVKGEIISMLNNEGTGWKRHTRVYGGSVCLSCRSGVVSDPLASSNIDAED